MLPLLWLRTNQTDRRGYAPLMLRLTLNDQKRVETSTQIKLLPGEWDNAGQKVTGANARLYNHRLTELKGRALQCFYDLDRQGVVITANLLKNALRGDVQVVPTVKVCAAEFLSQRDGKRAPATLLRYQRAAVMLGDYLKARNRPALLISEVTAEIGRGFLAWVLAGGAGNAYAAKIVRFFSQVCHYACDRAYIRHNPLAFLEYPRIEEDNEGRPLTDAELARLETNLDMLPTPALRDVARCFVFGCYTGLAYVDLAAFRRAQLFVGPDGGPWLKGKRQKTGKAYRMPFTPTAARMLGDADRLPLPSNPRYNLLLKVVAATLGLPADLSSHVARHTFVRLIGKLPLLSDKEREILTGDSRRVLRRHYEAMDDERVGEAFAGLAGAPNGPTLTERAAARLAERVPEPWLD